MDKLNVIIRSKQHTFLAIVALGFITIGVMQIWQAICIIKMRQAISLIDFQGFFYLLIGNGLYKRKPFWRWVAIIIVVVNGIGIGWLLINNLCGSNNQYNELIKNLSHHQQLALLVIVQVLDILTLLALFNRGVRNQFNKITSASNE